MPSTLEFFAPFDQQAVTEDDWRKFARHWLSDGPLISGLAPGAWDAQLQAYGDSSGMRVKVRTGEVWIRGHYGSSTTEKILAIASNSSGSTRTDLVVARNDFVNNRIEVDVVTGTPGAGAPVVTQSTTSWEVPLATVTVTNGAVTIAAGNVADQRKFVGESEGTLTTTITVFTGSTITQPLTYRYWRRNGLIHVEGQYVVSGGAVSIQTFGLPALGVAATDQLIGSWVGDVGTNPNRTLRYGPILYPGSPRLTVTNGSVGNPAVSAGEKVSFVMDYAALH